MGLVGIESICRAMEPGEWYTERRGKQCGVCTAYREPRVSELVVLGR